MALTFRGLGVFGKAVLQLQSFPVFCIYMVMVFTTGIWQRKTKPCSLRPVLIVYNLLCSLISLYTLVGFIEGLLESDHVFQKESSSLLRPYYYMYWVTKNVELFDTVFMVLRHRRRQISFLHVYHHASMLLLSDYSYHYTPWPAIAIFLALNSLVHVILYFYYCLTAWNPSDMPGWKQRLTEFQIFQFLFDFVFATIGYIHHGFCIYGLFYGFGMTALFSNFYYHAYLKKKSEIKKVQ